MNIAELVEIDRIPCIVIYAKRHGTHPHDDIPGFTCLETGQGTFFRFESEILPARSNEAGINAWLINHAQQVLGAAIESQPWGATQIDIIRVMAPTAAAPA